MSLLACHRWLSALLAAAMLLASCGGDTAQSVTSGGTGAPNKAAVVAGPITGFDSIVVNGVRFDESGARVTINGVADRPASELQLGMMVEITGVVDAATKSGKANTVVATALLTGPVSGVDSARGEVTILGQRVAVKAGTVLDGASMLSSVRTGDAVVVYGFPDSTAGSVDATRVEVRPASSVTPTTLIGRITAVTGTRFQVGSLGVESAGAAVTGLPAGLVVGANVEVRGTLDAAGILRASAVTGRSEFIPVEGALTEIEGYVTGFSSVGNFIVLGIPVNASAARVSGLATSLANGALVEVEGQMSQGVLQASSVEVKAAPQQPAAPVTLTVSGIVTDFVSLSSFRVRDQTMDASRATFTGGTAANLANGRTVEVAGVVNGNVLQAATVAFVAAPEAEGTRLVVSGTIEDFVSPARFSVNGRTVATTASTSYSGGGVADLANGRRVDVDGTLANGILTAIAIVLQPVQVQPTVSLSGVITDFVSPASFKVNNQLITTNGATSYEEGGAAGLANGRHVAIEGSLANGVVTATKVRFTGDGGTGEDAEVEGVIQVFVSVSNFTVKGQVIDASAAVFSNGKPADLAKGLEVHVTGPVVQGVLKAKRVEIDR